MSTNQLPPPLPNTLSSLRMTYMSLFNQILDNSININCICKTTSKIAENTTSENAPKNMNQVFDRNDFMSDSDDSDEEMNTESKVSEAHIQNLDHDLDKNPYLNRMCDLSCFENMRYVYFVLKNCFQGLDEQNLEEKILKFDQLWLNFKFINKNPKSCDYYGTTLFHYAAADNCFHLLKYSLEKYPQGVFCIDSKGMTPLMRAVQRNSFECVEYLLNETKSDLNGSSQSTYTPLWFAVSNGYESLAKILLNFNASPSIINKSVMPNIANGYEMMHHEDLTGIRETRDSESLTSLYLFSPLRASIVYSRYEIMLDLLKFNANVYEIFGATLSNPNLSVCLSTKPNEDYVNSLKFFFRQFGCEKEGHLDLLNQDKFLNILNSFIQNPNVYRRMFLEFVKYLIFKINSNLNLVDKLYEYLNRMNKNSIDYVMQMTRLIQEDGETELKWVDYVEIINDFMNSLDTFLSLDNNYAMSLSFNLTSGMGQNLRAYNFNLLRFSLLLMEKYFRPKSLMELCRYEIRRNLFDKINKYKVEYKIGFLKNDLLESILQKCAIPYQLKNYVLYKDN
ncbi:unnamed protein product [Brachionus calyciflorus]|uniref:SOCS box domain-containing protein n=1 Tax=Brachionus calyciflorus TaxID=104777 RepID=A0A814IS65_9BILA|nr:unnamed protein product [Brachionus calyciflorus]